MLAVQSAEIGEKTVIATAHEELRAKLQGYLDRDDRLRSIVTYTKQRFDAEKTLTAHNWEHIYRDTLNAIVIGEAEGADMEGRPTGDRDARHRLPLRTSQRPWPPRRGRTARVSGSRGNLLSEGRDRETSELHPYA